MVENELRRFHCTHNISVLFEAVEIVFVQKQNPGRGEVPYLMLQRAHPFLNELINYFTGAPDI